MSDYACFPLISRQDPYHPYFVMIYLIFLFIYPHSGRKKDGNILNIKMCLSYTDEDIFSTICKNMITAFENYSINRKISLEKKKVSRSVYKNKTKKRSARNNKVIASCKAASY